MKATLLLLLVVAMSCTSKKPDEQAFQNSLDSIKNDAPVIDEEVIGSILGQIPSPLEISVLLKESGVKYQEAFLNKPEQTSHYNSNFKMAINLGIYGTDLGYTNIYGENLAGIKYLSSIKTLADGLNIGQFFDLATIGRLATSSNNLDSLLLLTTQNFNSINHYLQSQSRSNLSVLILIGGWVEAMEITCQVAALNPSNKDLHETIGAQKIILEQLVLLLSFYNSDAAMAELLTDFKALQQTFDKIAITYTYKESTMEIIDGVAVIKDNSTTTINITEQDVRNIKEKTNAIRNKITS
jgi:hypothetical protein